MKRILFAAAAVVLSLAVNAQKSNPDDLIKVNYETYDFGKIKQNVPVTYYFEITNKSDKPVVVENSWGSCGCTTPERPVEPIAPGATAKLKVQYNAAALGSFTKDVYIKLAGVEQTKTIHITGETLEPVKYDEYVKQNPQPAKSTPATPTDATKTKTKSSKTKTKSGS
jgi:hypothetical protein